MRINKEQNMNLEYFERNTTSLTVTNNVSDYANINIGHYGFENSSATKDFVWAKDYPTFRLHYIIQGNLHLYVNGKYIPLKKEQCFLLRPDIDIGYKTDNHNPASYYWVSISGKNCKEMLSQLGFTNDNHFVNVHKQYRKALRHAFYANFNVTDGLKEIIDTVFVENFLKIYQLLYISLREGDITEPKGGVKKKQYIEKTLEYINNRYADPELTIREIAQSMFLHENYLSHIFREATGVPFRKFLTQKRIEESCVLMKEGTTSVNKVAREVGFSDPLYFSKVFKRYNAISPSEHLKKMKTDTDTSPDVND